jgi:hypothetical protein
MASSLAEGRSHLGGCYHGYRLCEHLNFIGAAERFAVCSCHLVRLGASHGHAPATSRFCVVMAAVRFALAAMLLSVHRFGLGSARTAGLPIQHVASPWRSVCRWRHLFWGRARSSTLVGTAISVWSARALTIRSTGRSPAARARAGYLKR